ncbi:pectate lyase family protein [Sphingomonas psychrotolerans]|uniref:Pectate lyase n=1 Tax=Sphingomonas psychrotolerans TaxID=1327635 RepID=A0A2K8MG79_9SPHN|nr:pectate lyase [Sphingomonas psychrotolerans]ATY31974.1 pectate lyase [Sphingomonas psychrotolerans]
MRLNRRSFLGATLAAGHAPLLAQEPMIAPTSGWASARGGTGGQVLRVTSLASDGPGSLRAALAVKGPRQIVFAVGGVIDLRRDSLSIREPFVTIDGESAPPPGITLIRGGIGISTHDVVIRHIRVRAGADGAPSKSGWEVDGLSTSAAHDVIVDHCSFAWATDENLSASGPRFAGGDTVEAWRQHTSRRISFTNNIVAEGLSHSSHAKGEHSKGSLIHDNVTQVLIAGNLYAHNYERNQLFKGGAQAVTVNNLIYNPGNRCMHYALNEEEWLGHQWTVGRLAIVGNVVRGGPSTRKDLPFLILEGQGDLELHARDNLCTHADGRAMAPLGMISNRNPRVIALPRPPFWPAGLPAWPSGEVEDRVLADAGARPWQRDAVDRRIVTEVRGGKGRVIDDERDVGGYPG